MAASIETDVQSFTDFLGQTVGLGDTVVYATTSSRSPVMKFATVEVIRTVEKLYHQYDGATQTMIPKTYVTTKVGVREISNARGFRRWDATKWDPEQKQYVTTPNGARVTYPMAENIVKVAP